MYVCVYTHVCIVCIRETKEDFNQKNKSQHINHTMFLISTHRTNIQSHRITYLLQAESICKHYSEIH